jgi:hypothetical protein
MFSLGGRKSGSFTPIAHGEVARSGSWIASKITTFGQEGSTGQNDPLKTLGVSAFRRQFKRLASARQKVGGYRGCLS